MTSGSTNDLPPTADALRSQRLASLDLQMLRLRYSIALDAYQALTASNAEQSKTRKPNAYQRLEQARAFDTLERVRRELRAALAADTLGPPTRTLR